MKSFVIYDNAGRVVRSGTCPETLYEIQAGLGESIIEGACDPARHYVAGGVITPYTPDELNAQANMKPGMTWQMPERAVFDRRSAQERLAQRSKDISRARALAYPPLTSLADALYWQSAGQAQPMIDYLAACAAVKAANPKEQFNGPG